MQSAKFCVSAAKFGWIAATSVVGVPFPVLAAPIYTELSYPGATATVVVGVDVGSDLTGYYVDSNNVQHGWFRLGIDGDLQTFDCPGAVTMIPEKIEFEQPTIYVYGTYVDSAGFKHGFKYEVASSECYDWQHTSSSTELTGSNDKGGTTGDWEAGTTGTRSLSMPPPSLQTVGYYRKPTGKFIIINVLDAQYGVHPMGLNNKAVVTGDYDGTGGFVWPLSTRTATEFSCAGENDTLPAAINDKGLITGECGGSLYGDKHGFVRDATGNITKFDPSDPYYGSSYDTEPKSINTRGFITGSWEMNNYPNGTKIRGFLRSPKGSIKVFDYPGAAATYPLAINDNKVIVGYYVVNGVTHGFERDP